MQKSILVKAAACDWLISLASSCLKVSLWPTLCRCCWCNHTMLCDRLFRITSNSVKARHDDWWWCHSGLFVAAVWWRDSGMETIPLLNQFLYIRCCANKISSYSVSPAVSQVQLCLRAHSGQLVSVKDICMKGGNKGGEQMQCWGGATPRQN